jgi:DNA-binding NtrC family response regulator
MNSSLGMVQQHPLQQQFLESLLTKFWNGSVYRFSSPEELSEVLENQRFGLVFCDVSPETEARFEALEGCECPVIGLLEDGDWEEEQLTGWLELGMVDVLTKPYQPSELERLCDRWETILSDSLLDDLPEESI